MLEAPLCPECGSPMVLRTARRGRNAGGQFWGCSKFPVCKATKPVDDAGSTAPTDDGGSSRVLNVPTHVAALPRSHDAQCAFFQACGLPQTIVEQLRELELDRPVLRSATQWRLDFPRSEGTGIRAEDRGVIAVAETLLTRGSTPLCSHSLERHLGQPNASSAQIAKAIRRLATVPTCRFLPLRFDSAEEEAVFGWITAEIARSDLAWSLVPQIALASLSPSVSLESGERGDFLLCEPEGKALVVEVDGSDHEAHGDRDHRRDTALSSAGVATHRIPASEARQGKGPNLDRLRDELHTHQSLAPLDTQLTQLFRWYKYCHQIQIALITAVKFGHLSLHAPWNLGIVIPKVLRGDDHAKSHIEAAVRELTVLLRSLSHLYGRELDLSITISTVGEDCADDHVDVLLGPADGNADACTKLARAAYLISDVIVPRDIMAPLTSAPPQRLATPDRARVRWFLKYLFRKSDFWEGQWETVERAMRGADTIVLLPTGAGKSIAFQLTALLLPGRCIVVDPIISLIDDQIDNLRSVGIDRCIGITSQLDTQQREAAVDAFRSGQYVFSFVAPERLQSVQFREALRALTTHTPVSLVAIDEAHCVSEWGHDFRTAYLNLGRTVRAYCASADSIPPLVALTGTASRIVLKDVQRELNINAFDSIITPRSFDRPELHFTVVSCRSDEKSSRLLGHLQRLPTEFAIDRSQFFTPTGASTSAGLVFCPHVNGSYGVIEQARLLSERLSTRVEAYSGGAPNSVSKFNWDARKQAVARDYKRNRVAILACTKAFGMGIDKPNVRYTIHIGLPSSIESFYQEAGRAGRDRRRAECAIILSNDDPKRSQRLLSPTTPLSEVAAVTEGTEWTDSDDIVRALWFHARSFRGEKAEVADIARVLSALGDIENRHQVSIGWDAVDRDASGGKEASGQDRAERALHRLVTLGVVEDYTVNYASKEFGATVSGASQEEIAGAIGRYAGAYQQRLGEWAEAEALAVRRQPHRAYVMATAEQLVRFVYEHIELSRRRALSEMLQAAASALEGADLRSRVLSYLEQSEWDERLEAVRASPRGGVDRLSPILDDILSSNDAAALRAATARALSSYADIPGLLILRGVSEALSADQDVEIVRQNITAALVFSTEGFRLDASEVAVAVGQAVVRATSKPGAARLILDASLASPSVSREYVRELLLHIPNDLAETPASWLHSRLTLRAQGLGNPDRS